MSFELNFKHLFPTKIERYIHNRNQITNILTLKRLFSVYLFEENRYHF